MIDQIGGRKMAIVVAATLICVGAVLLKGDVPAGLQEMLKYLTGLFIAGNVGADVVAAVAAKPPAPPGPAPVQQNPAIEAMVEEALQIAQAALTSSEQQAQALAMLAESMPARIPGR